MKKLICFLLFLFPCVVFAQEKESFTVSPEYSKLLENCCPLKKAVPEQPILDIGKMKLESEEFRRRLFRKRRLQIHATKEYKGDAAGWFLVPKPGRAIMLEYQEPLP